MKAVIDGPATPQFTALPVRGNASFTSLRKAGVSPEMAEAGASAPRGNCIFMGLPFEVRRPLVVRGDAVTLDLPNVRADWFVLAHTSDIEPRRFPEPSRPGLLGSEKSPRRTTLGPEGQQAVDFP